MPSNIIIAGNAHPHLLTALLPCKKNIQYLPNIAMEDLQKMMPDVEGLITTTRLNFDEHFFQHHAHQLKWIGRLGSGLDQIDLDAAKQKNIACINSPEGNRNAVAEHIVGLMLSLLNYIPKSFEEIKQLQWNRMDNIGDELFGKTIGIIGFGNNGERTAQLLQGFGVNILAYDKYKTGFRNQTITEATLQQIFEQADMVSLHVPLQTDTFHLVDDNFVSQFKKPFYLINACRGKVVDTLALITALQTKKILGAALDVLENEQIHQLTEEESQQLKWLFHQPNVILTPHIAGYSHQAFYKMADVLAKKIIAAFY